MVFRFLIFKLAFLFTSGLVLAENLKIDMTSNRSFSMEIAKIDVGQTIEWLPKAKGHNVEFIKGGVPEGVGKFKSKFNKDTEYNFTIPGIYAYWCTPHKNMGMIGFVVVGDDKSNLEAIKKIRFMAKSKKIAPDLINSL